MAAEWVPYEEKVPLQQDNSEVYDEKNNSGNEKHIQIAWNGNTYYVPESVVYQNKIEEYLNSVEINDGLEWGLGSLSLPAPVKRTLQSTSSSEPIRSHLLSLDIESMKQMDPADPRYKEIPIRFHSAYMLDESTANRHTGGSFGYPSSLYRVTDRTDSQMYALKRFDNVKTTYPIVKNAISKWCSLLHPSIVHVHSIFQEKGAVFFTYAYFPAAQTLKQRFIDQQGSMLSETSLWRALVQLAVALRYTHSRDLALRVVSPGHVLMTSGNRLRINYAGVPEVLEFESRKSLAEQQSDDLIRLGHLILSLGTRRLVGPKSVDAALNMVRQNYSGELVTTLSQLLSGQASASHILHQSSEHLSDELDLSLAAVDALHGHLRHEYENGRMLRLLIKMGFINERPEYHGAPQWAETGDRYILKLFRDYIFHQCAPDGSPVIDLGHVVSCLNKLDAGDREHVLLSSRDNKDVMLVASFEDAKRILEEAFIELAQQTSQAEGMVLPMPTPMPMPRHGGVPLVRSVSAGSYSGRAEDNPNAALYGPQPQSHLISSSLSHNSLGNSFGAPIPVNMSHMPMVGSRDGRRGMASPDMGMSGRGGPGGYMVGGGYLLGPTSPDRVMYPAQHYQSSSPSYRLSDHAGGAIAAPPHRTPSPLFSSYANRVNFFGEK